MIFIQLIQNKNVRRNISSYISLVSLICSVFAIIEINVINEDPSSTSSCQLENKSAKACQTIEYYSRRSQPSSK